MANLSELIEQSETKKIVALPKKKMGRRRNWMETADTEGVLEDGELVENKNKIKTEASRNKEEIKTEAKQNKKVSGAKFKAVDEFQVRMTKGHQKRMIEILIRKEQRAVIIEELAIEMKISREHTFL